MNRKNVYLIFCILGAAIPYSQFVPWVLENGMHVGLLVGQLFANRISAFFGLDVLVSSAVLLVFMRLERKQIHIRFAWLPIVGLCVVGVSLALPLFLIFAKARWKRVTQPLSGAPLRRSSLHGPGWSGLRVSRAPRWSDTPRRGRFHWERRRACTGCGLLR